MKAKNVNMLEGPIGKGLISMILPIMVMNVAQVLFTIIDMTLLKVMGFPEAVSSVGVTSNLISLITCLLIGLSVGANVIVANRIGSGQRERAGRAAMTSLLIAFIGGVVIMIFGLIFAETMLLWINCPKSLLPSATKYFKFYFLSVIPTMLYNFSSSILRSIGDTKRPMYYLLIGGSIKVLATYVFTVLLSDGVAGVGMAMIITYVITFTLTFIRLVKSNDIICINYREVKIDWTELKDILIQGIPSGLQSALCSFPNTLMTAAVNGFGAAATTGISVANQFDNLTLQIVNAPAIATMPFVAQNNGAGRFDRVKKTVSCAFIITAAFGIVTGSLFAFFSKEVSSLMTSDPAAIAFSQQKMIIVSSLYFLAGFDGILAGALRGMKKPLPPAITSVVFSGLFRILWIYLIFPIKPSLTLLYTTYPVGWILSIITLFVIFRITIKKRENNSTTPAQE